jgi:metal-dependent amidase/aminoacylase/carboxypeptidase family protein
VTLEDDFTPATYNNPELTLRLAGVFESWLGSGNVVRKKPVMGGEDFSEYGRTEHKIPICIFMVGAVSPDVVAESARTGKPLPSLHSPLFAPVPEPTIKTGVTAMTAAVLELMGKK